MKIIDRKNYFATVCEVYAMLSIGKILLEAFTHYKWGIDPVSYTHLDVYKRQVLYLPVGGTAGASCADDPGQYLV